MRRFLLILALFVVGTTAQAFTFPPMEGSDEPLHTAYALYVRENRALPPRATYLENCTRQQSGGPPLFYTVGALLLDALRIDTADCDAVFAYYFEDTSNPWPLTPDPYRADDNNILFLPDPTQPPPTGFPAALRALRMISVVCGAVAVIAAWMAAGEVFRREGLRLTATALFAFTPTIFHLCSYYTNDAPALAFGTLAAWGALRVWRRGVTRRRMLWIGAVVGVGALTKVSVLLAASAVAAAVILRVWGSREGAPFGVVAARVVGWGSVAAVPVALTVGVWAVWGLVTYGDPTGTGTHIHPTLNYDPPLGWGETLRGAPHVARTYVGLLGYANVYMGGAVVAALGAGACLAVAGGVRWIARRPRREALGAAVVLGVLVLAVLLGFVRWYRTFFDVTGRLLAPAHIAYAIGMAGGLWALARGRVGWVLRVGVVGIHMMATLLLTFVTLASAYSPQLTSPDALSALRGPSYTFDDTVRLLGYTTETDTLPADGVHTITLCWEVLAPTERLAAYAVRYVKEGIPAANRTTIHNLGKYNSHVWESGAVFCDAMDMAMGDEQFGAVPAEPDATYDILVFLLDADTGAVDWTATASDGTPVQFPVLGQVVAGR